jgi:hypothetical protein
MRNSQLDSRSATRRAYEAPRLVNRAGLVEFTKDVKSIGEDDFGVAPLDCRDPAGSVGFLL